MFDNFVPTWTVEELDNDLEEMKNHPLFARDITKIADNE